MLEKIHAKIRSLVGHEKIRLTSRGNEAIRQALLGLVAHKSEGVVLIPQEGGWLSYKTLPGECGLRYDFVKCVDGVLDLDDLRAKVANEDVVGLLYLHYGGYFACEPIEEIYSICADAGVMVILDVCGSIGTRKDLGEFGDYVVCSFRRWKLVNAGKGGFVSARDEKLFKKLPEVAQFTQEGEKILEKLEGLNTRVAFLRERCKVVKADLLAMGLKVVRRDDEGFVVIVRFDDDLQKEKVAAYCEKHRLEYTLCPRYIRYMGKGVSIEVKRL